MAKKVQKGKKKKENSAQIPDEKLFLNLFRTTEQYLMGKNYKPQTQRELMEKLSLPPQHTEIFKKVLKNLCMQNKILLSEGKYRVKPPESLLVKGTLRVHPRGFGFLQAEDATKYPQDIFIPKHLISNAVDGDTVEVLINGEAISEKGPEGKVVAILGRGRTHMAGLIRKIDLNGDIIAHVPLLGHEKKVIIHPLEGFSLREGDRIIMKVLDWGTKEKETIAQMSHYIGHISDPSCDIPAVIEEFELLSDFPSEVIEEAKSFGKIVPMKEIKARKDLRKLICVTIDPDTAKDFDDAISIEKDEKGHYHLGVHIADVSHYVHPGTKLDDEALKRCNSTYFPGVCIPMLPSELSNNLCSLKANVNRLTVSVSMNFNADGELISYHIERTVIKSKKRFTYKEAKEVLDQKKHSPYYTHLSLMKELCELLKKKRYERGSIEFALPDLMILVDEKGIPSGTDLIQYDITHQMVEEFMLKANEIVALHISNQGKNLAYRIHDEPSEENLRDFAVLAGAFGYKISDKPSPRELQILFDDAFKTSYGQYLATSYIRRMRLAAYSPENIGHYGLGLSHYCHFTSPIRRYVDLVAHRILFSESDDLAVLQEIAHCCSEQERISAKAENNVIVLKKLRFLKQIYEKDPYKQYSAIITRVKNFGIYFEVIEIMLEGFIHVSDLDDYYIYYEKEQVLKGNREGFTFRMGDQIEVLLQEIDLIELESRWIFVESERKKARRNEKKRKNNKKHRKSKDSL